MGALRIPLARGKECCPAAKDAMMLQCNMVAIVGIYAGSVGGATYATPGRLRCSGGAAAACAVLGCRTLRCGRQRSRRGRCAAVGSTAALCCARCPRGGHGGSSGGPGAAADGARARLARRGGGGAACHCAAAHGAFGHCASVGGAKRGSTLRCGAGCHAPVANSPCYAWRCAALRRGGPITSV